MFSVCDGHGTEGHKASALIKEVLPRMMITIYIYVGLIL